MNRSPRLAARDSQQPAMKGLSKTKASRYAVFVCICAAFGGVLFGFDIAVVSGTIPSIKSQFGLNNWLEGLFVSSALIGCMAGSLLAGSVSDAVGRKKVLVGSSILFLITGCGCALAASASELVIFRFIGGVGIGVSSMICPLYIAEVSPTGIRGRMVSLFQLAIAIGICVSLASNAVLEWSSHRGSVACANNGMCRMLFVDQVWRAMFLVGVVPALLFGIFTSFIPESPRWLTRVGKDELALEIFARICGREMAQESLREVRRVLVAEGGRLVDLFRKGTRRALVIAVFLAVSSELSGITVVLYYGPDLLNKSGVRLSQAIGGFVIIGIIKAVFTVVAVWLIDRLGRRSLLLWGTVGCSATLACLGVFFALHRTGGGILVALICLFCAFFAFSMGPVKWVVISEVFPTRVRGRAVAIATFSIWLADAFTNFLFPWARDTWGPAMCFFAFAGVLVPQVLFAIRVLPEMKGRTLEDIECYWRSDSAPSKALKS